MSDANKVSAAKLEGYLAHNWRLPAIAALLLALVSSSFAAQPQTKAPKIGFVGIRPDDSTNSFTLIRRELGALGYAEGKNVLFEYRNAENRPERLPALVDELIRSKVDVIVAAATNEARAAKSGTRMIPIVGLNLTDPVASGLIESFARPGGNLTGFTPNSQELSGKRLEILKEAVPKLKRVAVLWDSKSPTSAQSPEALQPLASALGLGLHPMKVSSPHQFESVFKDAVSAGSGALIVTLSAMINSNQRRIHELAARHRLPAIYPRAEFANTGGLMSYGADHEAGFTRAAAMIDKILKGTKPADIPVERPSKFEFVVNLKTAKQIGLTIPPGVLARADRVIR